MSKFTLVFSLALAASISVQAEVSSKKLVEPIDGTYKTYTLDDVKAFRADRKSQSKVQKAAKINSVDEICEEYFASSTWGLGSSMSYFAYPLLVEGENPNEVIIQNFYWGADIVATVNPESNELSVEAQFLLYDEWSEEDIELVFYDPEFDEFIGGVTAIINENGRIVFPADIMIAVHQASGGVNTGYVIGLYDLVFIPIPLFEYDEADWSPCGEAQFKDAWVTGSLGMAGIENTPAQTVQIMKHNTIDGDYLLVDPYQNEAYTQILKDQFNGYASSGYLRFNISDPDCVYVYPLVPSGAYIDMWGWGSFDELINYNREGYLKFLYEYSSEEIISVMGEDFLNVSYYDGETAVIFNPLYDRSIYSLLSPEYWWDGYEYLEGVAEITFDANGGESGINSISQNQDRTVRYFNIQGAEIKNPAKGQLVIKNVNGKSTKYIAR